MPLFQMPVSSGQQGLGFGKRFLVLLFRVTVYNNAAADIKRRNAVANDHCSDGDTHIQCLRTTERILRYLVPDRSHRETTGDILKPVDDIHCAYLGGSGYRAAGKYGP